MGKEDNMNQGAERLSLRKWGVFSHYLDHQVCDPSSVTNMDKGAISWNDAVNCIDVERLAYCLHRMNVGYYFLTLMQGTKHMIAPNAAFDAIAGTIAGDACSVRDIPMELADALRKYDIDLCLYFTGDGPYKNEEYGKKFGFIEPRRDVSREFVEKWASVLEEYSIRYGDKVKAWWMDGCYDFFGYDEELLDIYYNAIKKGNPNAAVAFNNGVRPKVEKFYPKEEFTAGESREIRTKSPTEKYTEGALSHVLFPLGYRETFTTGAWFCGGVKHPKEYVLDYIKAMNKFGGIVTIDILTYIDGSFDPEQEAVLRWVGNNL